MRFNPIAFLIGRTIAKNQGVSDGTATTDGFAAAIVRPIGLGIVLASVIARNQTASGGTALPPPPVIGLLDPKSPGPGEDLTINGQNFGNDASVVSVAFSWEPSGDSTLTHVLTGSQIAVAPTEIELEVPDELPNGKEIKLMVVVNGVASQVVTFDTPVVVP